MEQSPQMGASFPPEGGEMWVPRRPRMKGSGQLASICSCRFLDGGAIGGAD